MYIEEGTNLRVLPAVPLRQPSVLPFCHHKGSEQSEEIQTPDDGRLVLFTINELFILLFYSQIL